MKNDVKGLVGEDVSIDLIEDKITSFAIRELGLDDSKMSEDDKKHRFFDLCFDGKLGV